MKTKKYLSIAISLLLIPNILTGCNSNSSSTVEDTLLETSRVTVHDPSIVKSGDTYYVFGTHLGNGVTTDLASWDTYTTSINNDYNEIFASNIEWSAHGKSNYDAKGNLWAPDIIYNTDMEKWCLYMSVNGDNHYSSIALATADTIDGPYTYEGTVVYSGFTNSEEADLTDFPQVAGTNEVPERYVMNNKWNYLYGPNAIDPCVVYDKNGDLWMAYGSWFGGLFLLKLDNETGLRDYSYTYETEIEVADEYLGHLISGGYGGTGEGSYIVYDEETDYYYLYESYCGLDATSSFSNYHIRLFRSKEITGPYEDAAGNDSINRSFTEDQYLKGIKLFGNYMLSSFENVSAAELNDNGYKVGGHNSALIDDDGSRYLIYHTRFNGGTESHQVRVHQQFINEDGWPVTAVYEYLGSTIAEKGYSKDDIVGDYEFINHGLDATTTYTTEMLPTYKITLNKNGSISGDFIGTWEQKSKSPQCTIVIDGVTYKGVFFKQFNESEDHAPTMTFTLIGEDNQSIWGSK